jgi:hypothetical protein
VGKELKKRPPGKPGKTKNAGAFRELKAFGLSQAEVARRPGLASSTVDQYWQQLPPEIQPFLQQLMLRGVAIQLQHLEATIQIQSAPQVQITAPVEPNSPPP